MHLVIDMTCSALQNTICSMQVGPFFPSWAADLTPSESEMRPLQIADKS